MGLGGFLAAQSEAEVSYICIKANDSIIKVRRKERREKLSNVLKRKRKNVSKS
jgi:hypothetical protein